MYSDAPAARQLSRSPFIAFAVSAMIGSERHWLLRPDAADRFVTVHLRHHDVHQDDVDVGVVAEHLDRFGTAFGREHVHLVFFERRAQREDVAGVVVDDEDLPADERGRAVDCR